MKMYASFSREYTVAPLQSRTRCIWKAKLSTNSTKNNANKITALLLCMVFLVWHLFGCPLPISQILCEVTTTINYPRLRTGGEQCLTNPAGSDGRCNTIWYKADFK